MAVWSALRRTLQDTNIFKNVFLQRKTSFSTSSVRSHGESAKQRRPYVDFGTISDAHHHGKLMITPSRWQWTKFKDLLHFYAWVGIIPLAAIATYVNLTIGPAQLAPIPEGYVPKEWEYYPHPITRFFVRYLMNGEQQEYEKWCHKIFEEHDRAELERVRAKVLQMMEKRRDYKGWYYYPVTSKYSRDQQEDTERAQMRNSAGNPSLA